MSMKHLRSLAFCGLRKLGLNAGQPPRKVSRFLDGHELHQVNLIIGPNGGGKSTVVDIVRCLGDANMLPSLLREIIRQDTESGFQIFFDNGTECRLAFSKTDIDVAGVVALILPGGMYSGHLDLDRNEPVPDELSRLLMSLGVSVHYRNRHDESEVPPDIWLEQLNKQAAHLIGIGDYPLEPDQPSYSAPPGWRHPTMRRS